MISTIVYLAKIKIERRKKGIKEKHRKKKKKKKKKLKSTQRASQNR